MQPLAWLLASVLLYQGNRLRLRIPRLPEATGPARMLRGVAGDGYMLVDTQMIGSGFFAEDGFHPSSQGYRAWQANSPELFRVQ